MKKTLLLLFLLLNICVYAQTIYTHNLFGMVAPANIFAQYQIKYINISTDEEFTQIGNPYGRTWQKTGIFKKVDLSYLGGFSSLAFTNLTDAPHSYSGQANKVVSVNGSETGLVFTNSSAVSLLAGTGISVTGTYPNFTITNTSPSSGGTVTTVSFTNNANFSGVVSNPTTTPNLTLSLLLVDGGIY